MDSAVLAALAKWPDVPDVYGWLSLTARGQWRIRGEAIGNAAIRQFIGRNYERDALGRWFFQNGPQRVFVSLAVTPWVLRIDAGSVTAHNAMGVSRCVGAAMLNDGRVILDTEAGAGLVDDRDAARVMDAFVDVRGVALDDTELAAAIDGDSVACIATERLGLAGGRVPLERLAFDQIEARFGFVREPREGL